MEVTKTMTIGEIISKNEKVASFLESMGMEGIHGSSTQSETLEEACMVHGIEVDELLKKLHKI